MKQLLLKQKQVLFFIIAGGLSAIVEIGSFKLFSVNIPIFYSSETNFHGIHFPLSNILSTTCGIVFNYFLSIWFVFERGKHSKKREFAYFMVISFLIETPLPPNSLESLLKISTSFPFTGKPIL